MNNCCFNLFTVGLNKIGNRFFFQNKLAELGIIFSTFTKWQVKRSLFSSEFVVFRGYFSHSFAVFRGHFSIYLAVFRGGFANLIFTDRTPALWGADPGPKLSSNELFFLHII